MAAYTSKTAFKIPRRKLNPDGVNTETITTNKTLTYADSQFQAITNSTGGSLNVTLPEEEDGAFFWIRNQAGSSGQISVNNPAASGVVALTAGQAALVVCDTAWQVFIKA